MLEASPNVWLAEQGRTLAQWSLEMPSATGSYQDYAVRKAEAEKVELSAAELELAQARAALKNLVRQHAYLKLAFQKPWAASGGGSSLSGTGSGSGGNQ